MMISAIPDDVHIKVLGLAAGDDLNLLAGDYKKPLVISGVSGTAEAPVSIRGQRLDSVNARGTCWSKTVFGRGPDFAAFRTRGNKIAFIQEASGRFPGLHYIADEAILILRDCQWMVIEDLSFENCWPTAIYLENCQNITLRNLHFRGGTFAIGAIGTDTRHLLIEGCDWIQDPTGRGEEDLKAIREDGRLPEPPSEPGGLLWKETNWTQIHGSREETERLVDINADARAFDGDFFRAWNIAGYVVLRNNCILDAFNGVHFFNTVRKEEQEAYSRNVLIEKNWFVRLRDNAVEPENYAVNWTVRHNVFADCYATFSLEPQRSGFFYIYGNLCWNIHRPGPEDDERNRGRVFKFGSIHEAIGPLYVMFNTWLLRGPIFKKKRISSLVHMNNVVAYHENDPAVFTDDAAPFGKYWWLPHDSCAAWKKVKDAEKKRFTKFWGSLGIVMEGDIINHPTFPREVRLAGYLVGAGASGGKPVFRSGCYGDPEGLRLDAVCESGETVSPPEALEVEVVYPNDATETVGGSGTIPGAWQSGGRFTLQDPEFVRKNPQFWETRHTSSKAAV